MMLDNAREHGVDVHEGVRVLEVLFEGDRGVGVRDPERGRQRREDSRQGRRRCQRPEQRCCRTASSCASGTRCSTRARSGPTGKAPTATPARTKARPSSSRRRTSRAGCGTSRSTTTSCQRRRRRAVRLPLQGPRQPRADLSAKRSRTLPGRAEAASRTRSGRPATSPPRTIRIARTQVAGDGWVLVGDAFGFLDPLYSSGVLLALKSGELAADAIAEGLKKNDVSAAQLGKWGDRRSIEASIACAGSSANTTTASASATS